MPVFLQPPGHDPRGPDGKGWNRLRVDTLEPTAQCARRPRSYAALYEAQDTRRAQWGSFAPCTGVGACGTCPLPRAAPAQLGAFTDRVLVREDPGDPEVLWLMNHPERE